MHNREVLYGEVKMDTSENLVKAILKSAGSSEVLSDKKRLTCAKAFELAKDFEIEVIEIGRICNKHNIRICKCQLGCFV